MIAQALELCNRPHVVVATPGRIVDHLRSSGGEWDLSRVKFLVCLHFCRKIIILVTHRRYQVLDEADRLLTSTFAPELSYLFEAIPKERQTCLFTATWTPAIEGVADIPSWLADRSDPQTSIAGWSVQTNSPIKIWDIPGDHFQAFNIFNVSLLALS